MLISIIKVDTDERATNPSDKIESIIHRAMLCNPKPYAMHILVIVKTSKRKQLVIFQNHKQSVKQPEEKQMQGHD